MIAIDMHAWGWPQWVMAGTIAFNLTVGAYMDGMPKTGTHRFSALLLGTILGQIILAFGGFWS